MISAEAMIVSNSISGPLSEIVWRPSGDYLERSNIRRFMNRHGIASYEQLITRANGDIGWFWKAALEDLELSWYRPYHTVYDDSKGIAWTSWFLGGVTNVVLNCVDRHVTAGRGTAPALTWEGDDGANRAFSYAD